jgi:2-polyprenyl-3-methyl-5-hydroxy-6-metoxy-1,4-benzoquinol methylase
LGLGSRSRSRGIHAVSHSDPKPVPAPDTERLLKKEGDFWDLQEDKIESLYAKPHDWRFVPHLADIIIRPRVKTLLRILDSHKDSIKSLVDIGCGNGWFCHATAKRGINSIGIDLSPKKIETAKRMAKEQGIDHLCEFVAGDVMKWQPKEPVDLLTSHGSLHHFPGFHDAMDHIVEHHMRPDGYMLFVEPNHEGMAPEVREYLLNKAKSKFLSKRFDFEFFYEVSGQTSLDGPGRDHHHHHGEGHADPAHDHDHAAEEGGEVNVRDESPAGKEFFGEHIDLDKYFCENFDVIEKEFYHYFSSHGTNAFYVFMKSKLVRAVWRMMLPWMVRRDTKLLKDPKYSQWAEDGLWFMQKKGVRR